MDGKAARRKFWGWGYEGGGPNLEQQAGIARMLGERLGKALPAPLPEPRIEEIELPEVRVRPPAALAGICSSAPLERAGHAYGKSFRDVVRALRREFPNPPDVVARPRDESEVAAVLDWCGSSDLVAIPYGGGSSVVGGVEPPREPRREPAPRRSAPRDPFFDQPYEASLPAEAQPAWEASAKAAGPRSISANIKPKKKVAALFKTAG